MANYEQAPPSPVQPLPPPPPPRPVSNSASVDVCSTSAETASHETREAIASRLRVAAMERDRMKLTAAIAEAQAAGLTHESAIGKRVLSTL